MKYKKSFLKLSTVLILFVFIFSFFKVDYSLAQDSIYYHVVTLNPGWNIISTPRLVLNHEFSATETSANFDIYILNSGNSSGWSTMQEIGQTEFTPLYGYFINNKTGIEQTLTLNYQQNVEPDKRLFNRQLNQGWNVIGVANPTYALKQKNSNSYDNDNVTSILSSLSSCLVSALDFTADQPDKYSVKVGDAWSQKTLADANQLNDFRETKAYAVYLNSSCNYQGFQNNDEVTVVSSPVSLTIAKATTSPTSDVTINATNVTLGIFDFTASGEDIKVKDLNVQADIVGGANGGIDNGRIFVDDVQVGSTKDLPQATAVAAWGFGSSFIVRAGTTAKVRIVGDIKTTTSTSYTGGETIQISLVTGANNAQILTSLATFNAPESNVAANILNVALPATLTVTKYSGYGNQTVIAGTNGVKLGAFVISAGAAEGVNVSSITVNLSTDEAATITNMYLTDAAGVTVGTAKNVPGTSNIYSLSPNIALAANASKAFALFGNVKSASNVGPWVANIDASGSGMVTGNAVAAASATDIQTMTVASTGTLTVVNGSMPDAAILIAGSTGNEVAEYQFSAVNEGFTVDKLKLKVSNNFATSTAAVTLAWTDKNGVAKTKDGMFLAGAQSAATATFTGLDMYVPANGDATLKVYVSLTSIASGAFSGANSTISLDGNEGFNAVGDSGTPDTTLASADLESKNFIVRKSKPTFAKLDAGTDPVGGALYKFSVVADNAGNIEIKQLSFVVTTTGCEVNDLYLYEPNASVTLTDTAVDPTTEGSTVKLLVSAVDDDVLLIGNTAQTYEVRGVVTSYGTNDSILVRMRQDVTSGVANAVANTINGSSYNTWSDRSGVLGVHTTATADWTSGYLVKDMGQTQSFSK